jgi:hypothetical protein
MIFNRDTGRNKYLGDTLKGLNKNSDMRNQQKNVSRKRELESKHEIDISPFENDGESDKHLT